MRKSKEETAATRPRIVATAATEFRRQGIEATGLAELMAAAGLTHGGFYRHFDSKEQLVGEPHRGPGFDERVAVERRPRKAASQNACGRSFQNIFPPRTAIGRKPGAIRGDRQRDGAGQQKDAPVATASFSKLVDVLAAGFDDIGPAEAKTAHHGCGLDHDRRPDDVADRERSGIVEVDPQ